MCSDICKVFEAVSLLYTKNYVSRTLARSRWQSDAIFETLQYKAALQVHSLRLCNSAFHAKAVPRTFDSSGALRGLLCECSGILKEIINTDGSSDHIVAL